MAPSPLPGPHSHSISGKRYLRSQSFSCIPGEQWCHAVLWCLLTHFIIGVSCQAAECPRGFVFPQSIQAQFGDQHHTQDQWAYSYCAGAFEHLQPIHGGVNRWCGPTSETYRSVSLMVRWLASVVHNNASLTYFLRSFIKYFKHRGL